jgi:FixJ family two-component response regulator
MIATTPIIHVVDDDDSFRTAVMRVLRAARYVVNGYSSAGEFLLARPNRAPGCVVLDVNLPGPSGFDVQSAFGELDDSLPIIFLTGHGDIPMSVRAMKAGAVDFLTKPVQRKELLTAVEIALVRDARNRTVRETASTVHSRFDRLTPREREVFALVVSGKLNKQIAASLSTSERTIKAHRAKVMEKMNVKSLAELVQVSERLLSHSS